MKDTLHLQQQNIFVLSCGSYYGKAESELYMIYAPLSGNFLLATPDEVERLEEEAKTIPPEQYDSELRELTDECPISEYEGLVRSVGDVRKLSILPTFKCNFHCIYCYSEKGRAADVISRESLARTLKFFIDPQRTRHRNLTISYLGGGEPMLVWDTFKYALEYADELSHRYGFTLMNSVNTNGSILTDEILEYLLKYNVTVCITFEIFEKIQNQQRGQWKVVRDNLLRMCEAGVHVILSSIITPDSVEQIPDLLHEVLICYPQVKTIIFEPVVDISSQWFKKQKDINTFYKRYTELFFQAQPMAEERRVRLVNSVIRKMWITHERFCDGEISLTPGGMISGCTSVSSPKEEMFNQYCYGDANRPEGIILDTEKFEKLLQTNVYSYPKCENCFLKWHCCGGCQYRNDLYTAEELEVVCDFNRNFAKLYLLGKMDICVENEYKTDVAGLWKEDGNGK